MPRGYTRHERVAYQYKKIDYHYQQLVRLGESTDKILEKMLMSQALQQEEAKPEVEEPKEVVQLTGYLKYVKEYVEGKYQSMFVKEGEERSSIQLFYKQNESILFDLERLQNMELNGIKVVVKAIQNGYTSTDKPIMNVVSVQNYKEFLKEQKS
ncbi:hypothetical protein WAF17_02330 [Bernardetia sp. ABR2-2B]|uniref:hypothetical protein n=1 Tax=Bernardetia sp. ABR2-2B TaxID=3127472 RepID=UPI0030CBFB86